MSRRMHQTTVQQPDTIDTAQPAVTVSSVPNLIAGMERAHAEAAPAPVVVVVERRSLYDVCESVLSLYSSDACVAFALSREYSADEGLLRAATFSERPGAPSRLIGAVRGGSSLARVARLLSITRPGVVNAGLAGGKNALQWCVEALRPDLMDAILSTPGLEVWKGSKCPAFYRARTVATESARSADERCRAAACVQAVALSPAHPIPDALFTGKGVPLGRTVLWAGVSARLPDVVERVVGDARIALVDVGARNESGDTVFSMAACWARDRDRTLSVEERASCAAICRVLASSGLVDPSGLGREDWTHLSWAAYAGLSEVVSVFLSDPRVTAAVVGRRDKNGSTALSMAASWARNPTRTQSVEECASFAACCHVLLSSGLVDPTGLGGNDWTHLSWAAYAGLADVIASWLSDPRVTSAVVGRRDKDGDTAFSLAARWAGDPKRMLRVEERASCASCCRALSSSGLVDPSSLGGADRTHLSWAASAGLTDVVTSWLCDRRVTSAVVGRRDKDGDTAFSMAASWARDPDCNLSVEERASFAACCRVLSSSGLVDPSGLGYRDWTHLSWAAVAGLSDVIALWVADPRVTAAVVKQKGKF